MDFFEHQAAARRRTTLLVAYFAVAVVLIVAALNLVAAATLAQLEGTSVHRDRSGHFTYRIEAEREPALLRWRPDVVAWTTGLTLAVIAAGTLYRSLSLREGGRAVARLAGGRELAPGTTDLAERRLLNVVEEMSIASGVPMPAVFVLDEEHGLNAFAAGFTPSDAAIAVTRGSLELLTRDELQGVIAHEFSHILNGDMRLNIRLIGVLFGILMLAMIGRGVLNTIGRSRRRGGSEKGGGGLIALIIVTGLALLVIGYIGYFFGRLIQAAVSRQREFLADAAAVQFTRNPAGIGGALRKIGAHTLGSGIVADNSVQFRHFFFAQAFTGTFAFFATHPPLEQRIRAIDPQWDGRFPAPAPASADEIGAPVRRERASARAVPAPAQPGEDQPRRPFIPATPPPGLATAAFLASVGTSSPAHLDRARQLLAALPPRLAAAARTPGEALFVVFALLLAAEPEARAHQLETIRIRHGAPFADAFAAFAPQTGALAPELRLPLLNLALPALRALPPADIVAAIDTTTQLVAADGQVTLFEFMVEKALERHVAGPARGRRPGVVNYYSFGALSAEIGLLLSALARAGSDSTEQTARAFAAAGARIPALSGQLQLHPADDCGLDAISTALDKLVQASPAIRKVVLLAGAEAVAADGVIEPDEAELLRTVADALDCPIPPLLGSS